MEAGNSLYTPEDMQEIQEVIERDLKDVAAKNQAVLVQVKALVSSEAFQQIEESLSESGYTYDYQIVSQPVGLPQDDEYVLGEVFVDQTVDGGYTGDEFAGTVCMPINADSYFKFSYNC